jgi:hypothetical protein
MTRDQITGRVQVNLNDEGVFYSTDDLNDSIQDGYAEVAAVTGCIFKATTINLVDNLTYYDFGNLISDYLGVTAIFNPTTKQWLNPTNLRVLEELRDDWELAIGNPFLFWPINFRYVAIYPKPVTTSGILYIFYRATADVLSGLATPQIPEEYQGVLESYVTCDLQEQAEEFTKAQIEFKSYVESIKEIKQAIHSFRQPDLVHRLA